MMTAQEPTMEQPDALAIAFEICDNSPELVKLLAIGCRADGSFFTRDTGLTVDEAKELCAQFVSWMDQCLGREIERAARED
jgi:hypothetical protein